MNITLALVRLRDKEVGYMPSDMVLVTHGVAAKDLLQPIPHKSATHPWNW